MKTLIVVDEQYGFSNPNGGLYVKNGEIAVNNTVEFIKKSNDLKEVIFTVDFHLYENEAYNEPEINWPWHCMAYSVDAGIINDLIFVCRDKNIPIKVFIKGNTKPHTEYGAFEKIGTYLYENGAIDIVVNNRENNSPIHITTDDVIVCGIAGDYCVKNTIANLLKYQGPIQMNIEVFKDGIVSIDDGTTLDNFIKENNLKTI